MEINVMGTQAVGASYRGGPLTEEAASEEDYRAGDCLGVCKLGVMVDAKPPLGAE